MRGLMGSFAIMPLLEVVEFLARRRATGNLTCERGSIRKVIQLEAGVAVGVASNDPRERLGQLLLNFGHVTEEQLTKAFETQQATGVRLGKVLSMVGVVPPEVVRDVLALQIREALLDALLWDAGTFGVDDDRPAAAAQVEARVPLEEVVREAEFRTAAWRAFRAEFPTGTATLRVDDARVPPGLAPDGIDQRVLRFAREGRSIDEIALALHATDFHLYQRLFALHRQGLLSAAPAPKGEAPGPLGVAPEEPAGPSTEQLRAAMLDPPRTPRLTVPSHEVSLMRLSATEKYLLGRCDGARDLRQILQIAPLSERDVLRSMKRFVDARIVELG